MFSFVETPRKFIIAIINLRGVSTKLNKNIVTTIVLCQYRTTIDRTILINTVNSTNVVEPS